MSLAQFLPAPDGAEAAAPEAAAAAPAAVGGGAAAAGPAPAAAQPAAQEAVDPFVLVQEALDAAAENAAANMQPTSKRGKRLQRVSSPAMQTSVFASIMLAGATPRGVYCAVSYTFLCWLRKLLQLLDARVPKGRFAVFAGDLGTGAPAHVCGDAYVYPPKAVLEGVHRVILCYSAEDHTCDFNRLLEPAELNTLLLAVYTANPTLRGHVEGFAAALRGIAPLQGLQRLLRQLLPPAKPVEPAGSWLAAMLAPVKDKLAAQFGADASEALLKETSFDAVMGVIAPFIEGNAKSPLAMKLGGVKTAMSMLEPFEVLEQRRLAALTKRREADSARRGQRQRARDKAAEEAAAAEAAKAQREQAEKIRQARNAGAFEAYLRLLEQGTRLPESLFADFSEEQRAKLCAKRAELLPEQAPPASPRGEAPSPPHNTRGSSKRSSKRRKTPKK